MKVLGKFRAVVLVSVAVSLVFVAGATAKEKDPSPGEFADDPRSGAALNREAALEHAGAPESPSVFGPEVSRRLNLIAVNDPTDDATARDTQSETTVAVDGSNVVAAWNDSGSFTGSNNHFTGFANSTDGGATFTDRGALPTSTEGDAGDPVLAYDNTSNALYLSTLGFTTGENLQVFKSTNNGQSFGAPVNGTPGFAGTGDFQDKEWLTVDNFAGAPQGNVYLCWTRFFGSSAEIRFTRSTDDGATFTPNTGLLLSTGGQGCFVAVGPGHEVYVFYYRGTGGGGQGGDNKLFVRKSTDNGVSFAPEVEVADLATTTTNGNLGLAGGLRSNSFPHAAVNPVSGDIIAVYNDDPNTGSGADNGDAFMVRSLDGGATWTNPVTINDGTIRDQFFPTVGIDGTGTRVMFGYYSREHDPSSDLFHRRGRLATMSTSTGGVALRQSFQLSPNTPIAIGQDPAINPTYMGDYDQIVAPDMAFHSTWADNRDGNAFHAHQPDVFNASVAASNATQVTDLSVAVNPTPGTIDVGDNTTLDIDVTATGGDAREVFVNLRPAPGLAYQSATPGARCDVIDDMVGCAVGSIAAGSTSTVQVEATGIAAGTSMPRATATTSNRELETGNNTDVASVTVNDVMSISENYSTGNIAVPINDLSTVNVPLNVPTNSVVLDVNAYVRLNHTYDGDLDMFLVNPAGEATELSTDNGSSGDNFGTGANSCAGTKTVFDDQAATAITAGTAPFAGSFKPEQPLADHFGTASDGTWNLRIADDASLDTGTVGCFILRIKRPT